jgi:hypothetical protein
MTAQGDRAKSAAHRIDRILIAWCRPFHFEPGEDLCLPVQIVLVPGSKPDELEQLLVFLQIADLHEEY